jgi:WD40 repeat protein
MKLKCCQNEAHTKEITSLVLLQESCQFASASLDRTVKIWDYELKLIITVEEFFSGIRSILLLVNGELI